METIRVEREKKVMACSEPAKEKKSLWGLTLEAWSFVQEPAH